MIGAGSNSIWSSRTATPFRNTAQGCQSEAAATLGIKPQDDIKPERLAEGFGSPSAIIVPFWIISRGSFRFAMATPGFFCATALPLF